MAFMRVNGMAIPVKAESCQVSRDFGGEFSRSMSGTPVVNELFEKRVISGVTKQLPLWEAERIRKIIEGDGHLWPFTADTYSSKGLAATTDDFSNATELPFVREKAQDSDSYETLWQPQGINPVKWTNAGRALWAPWRQATDESINNLLDAADRRCSSAAGFHVIGGASVALDSDNYVSSSFPNSVQVTVGGAGGDGAYVDINPSATDYYSASVYVRSTVGTTITVTLRDETNATDLGSDTVNTDHDKWQRITISSGQITSASSDLRLIFSGGGSSVFYVALPQIERNRAPNMWNDGDGDAKLTLETGLSYVQALGDNRSFSIRGWCYPVNDFGSENSLFTSTLSSNERNVFYLGDATNYIEMYVVGSSWTVASAGIASPLTFTASPDNWLHFTVAVDRDAGSMTVQIGGASVVSDTEAITSLDFSAVTNGLTVGDDIAQDNTRGLCGMIQDIAILPYAISPEQHDDVADAGKPFAKLSKVHVDGDMVEDKDFTAEFVGKARNASVLYGDDGTSRNNMREVSFELMEV